MLLNISKNLREIVGQYPLPENLTTDEQALLTLRFKAVLQHYLWFYKDTQHIEAKKLYKKLSIYFHPDKFDSDVNQAEPNLLQKQDIAKIASFLKKGDDNQGKDGFFKIISEIYTGEFDSTLGSLEQALVKPTVPKPKKSETSTSNSNTNTNYDYASYYRNQNTHYSRPQYQQKYYQHHYQHQSNYQRPQENYWRQESYRPREYTQAELFELLEKHLTKPYTVDIDNYINKLTLEVILNKFIQEKKYDVLENLLRALYAQKKLETNCLNQLLNRAIQHRDVTLAKIAIHYGATTVDSIYNEAMKKYDNEALYVLFEALPDNHSLKYGSIFSINNAQSDFYYLNKMHSEWLINPYIFTKLSPEQKMALNCYEIYDYISQHKIPALKILSLSVEELKLIQYPGFYKFYSKVGDFDRALDTMKRRRSILNQPIIRELASRGLQHRYPYKYGYSYDGYKKVDLEWLLSLGEQHIENLNNQNVIDLIKSDIISLHEGIFLDERQKELLKLGWVRQEMSCTTKNYPLDILNYVYNLKYEEIKLISSYIKYFPFLDFNTFLRLSAEDKEKLTNFMPMLKNYSCITVARNGYEFSGLNFNHILDLSTDMIKKLAYPHSPELYFNQGKMGEYLLNHFPESFFAENKNISLEALFNKALFYACQNDMPEFIDLYTNNHDNSEGSLIGSLFMVTKNCLNLYNLTNQNKQTLEEVAVESKANKAASSIKNNTYYFDFLYQNAHYTGKYLKESIANFASHLISRIVP